MENSAPVSDEEIAKEALAILTSADDHSNPILLSALGMKLSTKFSPWREVLAGRLLSKVLASQLRDRVIFEGEGPQQMIRLSRESELSSNARFDKTIWAAFSKPIPPGTRRILRPRRPFRFTDEAAESPLTSEADSYEVEPDLVPSEGLPRPTRDQAIIGSIKQWASLHNIELNPLLEVSGINNGRQIATSAVRSTAPLGVDALVKMIAAIPVSERKNYSLPLDLIYRLISCT
jgi:hypothetical protein